jgi:hypothetical protein
MLAVPATAVALTARQPDAPSTINVKLNRHHVAYGKSVTIRGTAYPAQPGQPLALESADARSPQWRTVASTTARSDGSFTLVAALKRSGLLRVQDTAGSSSTPRRVTVAAKLELKTHTIAVLAGHFATVRGKLLPEGASRRVRLEGRASDGPWHLLTSDRTGARGGFRLRYSETAGAAWKLRVHFSGDRDNTHTAKAAGPLTVFEPAIASWYYDAGMTACGFHGRYGVANRSLPCGTKVTFRSGARQVTAVVDDRGPFVAGRTWDLGQSTAGALGFVGVGSIWSSR